MAEYTTLLGMLCGASDNEDETPPIKVEPLHLKTLSHCLHNLVDNQRRSIGEIAEIFQIDKESRRKFGNELVKYQQDEYENEEDNGEEGEEGETPLDESSIDDLFRINKALSLDKLPTYFMYQRDSPLRFFVLAMSSQVPRMNPRIRVKARSIRPRKVPITAATAITMMVRRVVSSRLGHVTLRNSEMTSPKTLMLKARRAASELSRPGTPCCLANYRTSRCNVRTRQRGQNFFSSIRDGSFRRFLEDE